MKKRILSPDELMPEYIELLNEGAELPLSVSGASMLPFLYPGRDAVWLTKPKEAFKRGDILLYRRSNGRWILHRLRKSDGDGLWFSGDAQDELEGPIAADSVFAIALRARRKGKQIGTQSPVWIFYKRLWSLSFGHRRSILGAVSRLKKHFGRHK